MFAVGIPAYPLGIGVSTLSAKLGLAVYALVTLFYLFDVLPPLQRGNPKYPASTESGPTA